MPTSHAHPRQEAMMLKVLIRNFSVFLLVGAFAAPSALATQSSHHARSRAHHARSRVVHPHGVHRRAKHKPHHKSAAPTIVSRTAATISTTTLLGDNAVETHVDSLKAGHAKAFSFQASD